MAQTVAADLEIRVGHQLRRPLRMRLHPFAAGEEGRLHAFRAQQIDDAPVIAGNAAVGLAKIEGERDQLHTGGKLDASDRAAHGLGYWRGGRERLLPQCREVELGMIMLWLDLAGGAGKRLRREAAVEQVRSRRQLPELRRQSQCRTTQHRDRDSWLCNRPIFWHRMERAHALRRQSLKRSRVQARADGRSAARAERLARPSDSPASSPAPRPAPPRSWPLRTSRDFHRRGTSGPSRCCRRSRRSLHSGRR